VAERFGTEHHELAVEPDAAAVLPTLAWHFDEPFGDSSAVPTYYVARLTRQHVTVALGGDGGDEVFGGYERYLAAALAGGLDRMPAAGLIRALAGALGRLLPRSGRRRSLSTKAARFLAGAGEAPGSRYAHWICQFHGEARRELCTPELLGAAGETDPLLPLLAAAQEASGGASWQGAQAADLALYLPDDLLRKVDIASMASGLEVRSPFLDHTLVEFAATIPAGLKLRGRTGKQILRTALAGLLPPSILARPKMGFGVPIDHWLRGELRELMTDCLLSPRALGRGYFRPAAVRRLVEEHAAGGANWRDRLWTLLMLELWHRTFLDGDGVLAGQRRANVE
jgi:asparagine synthase (glutamine-hydrolysing)